MCIFYNILSDVVKLLLKKLIGKLSFLVFAFALDLPVSASAATIETVNSDSYYTKLSQRQLLSQDGVTIK
ncbi:MAG: hypothetical protein EOM28_03770 [Clostridia bacterium]|nr:hypothetical protein [Clostridia bacterium]